VRRERETKIRAETAEVSVARRPEELTRDWCPECARKVRMLTLEKAAAVAGVNSPTVYHWVETGKIHFAETGEGAWRICFDALYSYAMGRFVLGLSETTPRPLEGSSARTGRRSLKSHRVTLMSLFIAHGSRPR
jgi:excisionase family DNA binding protein